MPQQRFSRQRVIDTLVADIHQAPPNSHLARMITVFGLSFERAEPVPKMSGILWKTASELGLVWVDDLDGAADWTELAFEIFPRLGFREPTNIERAIKQSNGKIIRMDPGVAKANGDTPQPDEAG